MKIVAVTGTNGKTTTTNLIKTILEEKLGAKVGLIGTNQNMIGQQVLPTERTTPESYEIQELFAQMYQGGCTHVVMEVSSHALYLDRVYGIEFEVGVFTNLTQDHLDFHKTMLEYGRAKAILFSRCKFGCINIDDEYSNLMLENATCKVLTYSAADKNADFVADNIRLFAHKVEFTGTYKGHSREIMLSIPGNFSVYNAMSALTACLCLGVDFDEAAEALADCSGVMGRAEVVPTGRDFTMLIDYAHTPDALENIISTVRATTDKRVVTLFGCGGDRDRTKRPIMGAIAAKLSDFVIVTSDNPRTEEPGMIIKDILAGMENTDTPYTVIENRKEAIGWAIDNARSGDVIILAGK
jgi:UDP-N-acetylmuramoyl-L-alanyl-D-glutamate--2,6-diaminopimelate ligase